MLPLIQSGKVRALAVNAAARTHSLPEVPTIAQAGYPDILVQSAAANAALNAFNKELLASHLRSCVANDIREGHDEVIDELVVTLQKLMK